MSSSRGREMLRVLVTVRRVRGRRGRMTPTSWESGGVGNRSGKGVDPRSLPKTPEGVRRAWSIIDETWSATFDRAQRLPASAVSESVNGEWSFIETQRHLVFVTDAWIRRTVLGEQAPYHALGMPPDHRTGQPEPGVDVTPWGIDVCAEASWEEVLDVRAGRMRGVRALAEELTDDDLRRICAHNPAPGFPPSTTVPVGFCLDLVVGEEWAHHGFATRDLDVIEKRRR
jgi:hypothetical protein